MDPGLFSEWAQIDDHLRRAIIVRDALGCRQPHERRMTVNHRWPQTYYDWSGAEMNTGELSFVMAREERGAYIRRKLHGTDTLPRNRITRSRSVR